MGVLWEILIPQMLSSASSYPLSLILYSWNLSPEDSFSFPLKTRCGQHEPSLFSAPQTSQCMWLMQALGFLLSALQVEEILKNLHSLISPYIQQLEKLAEEIVSELWCPGAVLGLWGFLLLRDGVGTGTQGQG